MRLNRMMLLAGTATFVAAGTAGADFPVDLGSGDLVGNETRFVEMDVDTTMLPSGNAMVGFDFSMDYVAGSGAEWASDMGFWINDADGNPSVQIGGYNVLFADVQGPLWGFDGAGSAATGTYTDSQSLLHSGIGMWRFTIGNGWSAAGAVGYNNVSVFVLTGDLGVCGSAEGSCGEAHGTPGCSDLACCQAVCDFEAFCCDVEWDEFCVDSAVKICGIYQYNCPPGGPANNCPTNATVVMNGDVVAFSTVDATQVAPDGCEDYDPPLGPDVWYQFTAPANGTLVASTCDSVNYDNKTRGYNIGDGNFDPSTLPDLVVACNDDGAGCSGFTSVLTMAVIADTTYLVAIGGYQGTTGAGDVTFTFTPDEVIPPYECASPGANPYASAGFDGVGGVACQAGGITTPNNYAVVFTQSDIGAAYSFSCVNFGLDNSGSYLEGNVSIWIDEDGGDPSVTGMTLVQSFPVGLYSGDSQQVTVSGDSMCIELTGAQTLVVTLFIEESLDGFATFSGAATGATTYIASDDCGIADFITMDSIGFPDNKWAVELSGDIGCEDGIIGDLNGDGIVNGADLTILASAWGTADPVADLNDDGIVNGADLSIQLSNWTG